MKVLIVTLEPFPYGMAAVNRIKCYAKALSSADVSVEILIVFRTEHEGLIIKNKDGVGSWEGIPFKYAGKTTIRAKNLLIRKFNDYKDIIITRKYIRKTMKKGDAVLCYMKERGLAVSIAKICHSIGIPCIRDLCEYPYIAREQNETVERKRIDYMKHLFPYFDGIIVISQSLFEYSQQYKRADAKIIKVPIMVNCEGYDKIRRQYSPIPFFFHSGTMIEQKDGILGVIEAFGKTKQRYGLPVMYYFTGKLERSSDAGSIISLIKKYNLDDNLKFLGYLNDEEIRQYQANCVAMVINKHDNLQNKYCFATKLGEYLLSGRPVIASKVGEVVNYLVNRENALLYDDNDIEGLSELMFYVLTHEEDNISIGQNGRNLAISRFDYHVYGKSMREFIESL